MINSAKTLGWVEENNTDEDQKDVGCLVKLSIDRIQFPIQLATQSDKDQLNIFAQYRFYDKSIEKKQKSLF